MNLLISSVDITDIISRALQKLLIIIIIIIIIIWA